MRDRHEHCPFLCEHPYPFDWGSRRYCIQCWMLHGIRTEVIPCNLDTCDPPTLPAAGNGFEVGGMGKELAREYSPWHSPDDA